jgi:hypothetical protein
MSLSDATTLNELIYEGRTNNFNINNYCTWTQIGDNLLTIGGNILDKYIMFLDTIKIRIAFTEEDYMKYKYRPKELSKKLYGTEELATVILKLNNISHEADFINKKVYALDPANATLVLNKIISINEDVIAKNHSEF